MKRWTCRWQTFNVGACCSRCRVVSLPLEKGSAVHCEVTSGILKLTYLMRQQLKTIKFIFWAPFFLLLFFVQLNSWKHKRNSLWSVWQKYTKCFISIDSNYWETLRRVTFKSLSKQSHSYKLWRCSIVLASSLTAFILSKVRSQKWDVRKHLGGISQRFCPLLSSK